MTEMVLSLFEPNTLLPHRAGIAGLALALDALSPEGAPLSWEVTEDEVRLSWEGRDLDAIMWLVRSTYQIEDGYLNVPALNLDKFDRQGRFTLSQGILSTFLQHGQQKKFIEDPNHPKQGKKKFYLKRLISLQIEPGSPEILEQYQLLESCYYTGDFPEAFNSRGQFKTEISLKGHHLPGLEECFVNGTYKESPSGFVALLFLPLACGYYQLPSSRSALVIPEVTNLKQWVRQRQKLPGRTYTQFRASGAGESGLRFLLQEKAISDTAAFKMEYCEVYQLGKQAWNANQNYIKQAVYRIRATDKILALYDSAAHLFPARMKTNEKGETWLATSTMLPWIADNLIARRPWYLGFYEFRKANKLYEREGLVKMTQYLGKEDRVLFDAVQDAYAIFRSGQFDYRKDKVKRDLTKEEIWDVMESSAQKAIYRLQRPKTQQQFASALVDFLSQYRGKSARGKGLQIAGWIHGDRNWRKARDLALLAIATYQSKAKANSDNPETNSDTAAETESEGWDMAELD